MAKTMVEWIDEQLAQRKVRSLQVLARELGVDPEKLGDWALGYSLPNDQAYQHLAASCGTPEAVLRGLKLK